MISPVSFNGVALNDGFFKSDLLDTFNADKDLTLNDLLGDGQAWGSSKVTPRKLVLNIVAGAHDLQKLMQLNQMLRGNQLKPLVIDTDIGRLAGQAEITSFAWSDDSPLIISAQLTMPDPYWYAQTAKSVQLGATYSSGVVFGPGQGVIFGPRNVIQNGDFAKDSDGDGVPDGLITNNITPVSLLGEEFTFKATANNGYMMSNSQPTAGHRYFICAIIKATGNAALMAQVGNSDWRSIGHPGDGQYHTICAVEDFSIKGVIYIQDHGASNWQNISVKDFRAIDIGTASAPTPDYNLTADEMAAKYPNYQQEYGGVVFGTSTGGAGTIANDGNADAYPVIHVVGTCSGPSITNLTTGETVSVNVTLGDGDELIIDCRPETCGVYLNGVANIGLKTSSGWMRVVPGDNKIVFSRNSLQSKKHCTVEFNERWI